MNGAPIASCSGTFYDGGGANGNYSNNQNLNTTICPVNGKQTRLDFINIELLPGDQLCFHDGSNVLAPVLACASDFLPGQPFSIQASAANPGGCLTLSFISDASGSGAGWQANLSCADNCFFPAPDNLRITGMSNSNMTWTWNAVPGSQGYEVNVNGAGWIPSNGGLSHIVSGLTPGQNVVIEVRGISDVPGCTAVTVSANKVYSVCTLMAGLDAIEPAKCFGTATGSALVLATDAMGAVQFFVDNNPAAFPNGNFTGIFSAGDHIVIAQDAAGCLDTVSFTITEPLPISIAITVTDAKCFGGDNGEIAAAASGGTGPYHYKWQGCQGGNITQDSVAKGLFAGCYAVLVTDDNGCTASKQDSIRQGVPFKFISMQDSVHCFGGSDGKATVKVSGARPPYTYVWDNGDKTPTADSLKAGAHFVSVKDSLGCTATTLVQVLEPTKLLIDSISSTNLTCFGGSNGTAKVFAHGGVMPYMFTWSNLKTTQLISGLTAGPYTVTVTGLYGCTASASALLNQPTEITIATTVLQAEKCAGACDGAITLTPSGGTGQFNITWDKPAIPAGTFSPKNLCPGTYNATITDANGCTKTAQSVIKAATPLSIQLIAQPPACTGDQNGSLDAKASGGSGQLQYSWNTGATSSLLQNLACGIYTVTVTDSLGCKKSLMDTLPCPKPIALDSIIPTAVRCFGEANGKVSVSAHGGTGTLMYKWSDANQQFDPTAVNLIKGVYIVTITDANGCTLTASATVTEPPALSVTLTPTHVTCFGEKSGTVTAVVTGGGKPYTYKWNVSQDSSVITGLGAGTYTLSVTDVFGCKFTGPPTVVTQPATPVQVTATQTQTACFGEMNGIASASAIGSNGPPFSFSWSNGSMVPAPTNFAAGTYTVTATDSKGCTGSQTISILEWKKIEAGLLRAPPSCHGGPDGQVAVNQISGGAGDGDFSKYHYQWGIPGAPDSLYVNGLTGGETYTVTITDDSGCSFVKTFVMLDQEPIVPTLEADNISCFGLSDGEVRVATVQSPNPIIQYNWSSGDTTMALTGVVANSYTVTLTDSKGCTETATAQVVEPPELVLHLELITLVCNNDSNGMIRANVTGGTPIYNYAWNTGANTVQLNDLGPGKYVISVTDKHGCQAVDSTDLSQPNPPDIQTEAVNPSCYGAQDGLFHLIVTGSGSPYRYSLDGENYGGSSVFLGLKAGAYTAYVRDKSGCLATVNVTLNEPPKVEVSFGPDLSIILGDSAVLSPDIANAFGAVSYSWKSALVDSIHCVDLPDCSTVLVKPGYSNTYFVTVTDANGCHGQGSTRIEVVKPRGAYVPSGFSPNNDGSNDLLSVYGKSLQIRQVRVFRVYDRWGELVYEDLDFQVNDALRGWDGRLREKDCQTGVYVWYLEVEYQDGYVEALRGNCTLIR